MPVNATARDFLSDVLKGVDRFHEDSAVRYNFETVAAVDAGGPTTISNGYIGLPLLWDEAAGAFLRLAAPADWAAATAYVVGDIVKPAVRDGNEYVCVVAGTSDAAEPTFITTEGATTTDNTVTWIARKAYAADAASSSTLKNKSRIAITVGDEFGVGFNKNDLILDAVAVNATVLYRGEAAILAEGIKFGAVAAADQAEFLAALEDFNITVIDNAEVVSPTFTS